MVTPLCSVTFNYNEHVDVETLRYLYLLSSHVHGGFHVVLSIYKQRVLENQKLHVKEKKYLFSQVGSGQISWISWSSRAK